MPENVYNIDETGVILSMLGSVKVLISKDDRRDYRDTRVKREMVTAIECVSAAGELIVRIGSLMQARVGFATCRCNYNRVGVRTAFGIALSRLSCLAVVIPSSSSKNTYCIFSSFLP